MHGLSLLPLYTDAECTEDDRKVMLNSLYLATLHCTVTNKGDNGYMEPVALSEIDTHNRPGFVARRYHRGASGNRLSQGFGFVFWPKKVHGTHRCRTMVLDFGQWKLRHFVHYYRTLRIL